MFRRCAACALQQLQASIQPATASSSQLAARPILRSQNARRSYATSSDSESTSSASTNSTPSTSSSSSVSPPPLPRPLGLTEPPRKHVKPSLRERAVKMADKDARMEERRHLIKEASTGYFEDYNKLRHQGGKLWVAPRTLIQEKAALYFPEMTGTSLASSSKEVTHTSELLKGKISIVSMLNTRMSEAHIDSYVGSTAASAPSNSILNTFKQDSLFQYVQVNCQENTLKWLLVGIFLSSLRRSVPEDYRKTYLVSTENLEYIREPMGMTNKHLGYIYLVDENCKIRWAALSFAQRATAANKSDAKFVDEVSALSTCTSVLLERLRGKTASSDKSKPAQDNKA